jgi:siderophore-iron reductase FhuF
MTARPPEIPEAALKPVGAWICARDKASAGEVVTLGQLLEPGVLAAAFAQAASRGGPEGCLKAGASVWSKSLLSALIVVPAFYALAGSPYRAAPRFVVRAGRPSALVAELPARWGEAAPAILQAWLESVVAPTVERLAAAANLAPRVFWSNAATMFAWLGERWSGAAETAAGARQLHDALLFPARWPDGAPNPFHRHIDYVACAVPGYERGTRRRRLCCLRDRLGQTLCAGCPKIEPAARDLLLAAAARD